jgi:Domain of unknown function (DUF5069)
MAEMSPVFPRSAYDRTAGLVYFARMLDKIRLHAAGNLPGEYHAFLGDGFDGRITRFLGVSYPAVRERTLTGGSDEEILGWCLAEGRPLTDEDFAAWSKFACKHGWRDEEDGATERLAENKRRNGLSDRDDIMTFFDFYEVDEKRRP